MISPMTMSEAMTFEELPQAECPEARLDIGTVLA